ncbi:MAG: DUF177 domain-containing protein [Firmicutes bacterium]|jgi:uncharacterized protein|nr:DUF177 domain-containing protein [Bacillota bacterium]
MKIDVAALKNAPGKIFTYTFTVAPGYLQAEGETTLLTPLAVDLEAMYCEGKVIVKGNLRTKVKMTCSRCLQQFSSDFYEEFEDEIPLEQETEIDLTGVISELFLTALPFKPLCREACKGLCPVCGTDLNVKQCGCPAEDVDPRLAVLKKFSAHS